MIKHRLYWINTKHDNLCRQKYTYDETISMFSNNILILRVHIYYFVTQ